uniref:Pentacotripeptide-repeat region of PRORP domain-containing protein n=1 Tax=Salix viminalis TaxID=40686 RepID=A0A6N2MXH3_SALVM
MKERKGKSRETLTGGEGEDRKPTSSSSSVAMANGKSSNKAEQISSSLHFGHSLPHIHRLKNLKQPLIQTLHKIPDLFDSFKQSKNNPSPFSFLSTLPFNLRTRVIDEIIQSLIPIRPRFRNSIVYSSLLSYTLQNSNLFPLSLAIIQCTLRSGCLPVPQTHVSLSSAWLDSRREGQSVGDILMEMKSIGYNPDCVDRGSESLEGVRKCDDAIELVKEMVVKMSLSPRQGVVVKVLAALRANREMRKAGEMIEFLENEGYGVGFESYELVVEGCLECKDFILAAKVVMGMTEKGFIPYIKVRQKVVEGLIDAAPTFYHLEIANPCPPFGHSLTKWTFYGVPLYITSSVTNLLWKVNSIMEHLVKRASIMLIHLKGLPTT